MSEDDVINSAISILEARLKEPEALFTSSNDTKNYLKLKFSELEYETFSLLLLNNQHGLISCQELFRGTINGAAVYPREVVKVTLAFNAAAVIFTHNHPSGQVQPSSADKAITSRLKSALESVDIRVLDHVIVGGRQTFSFAEHGLL